MFMILRFGLKNIDFLGKMKAEKFVLLMHPGVVGGYVPNRERNHKNQMKGECFGGIIYYRKRF